MSSERRGTDAAVEARESIRTAALRLGFLQVGFAPATAPPHTDAYLEWLREGRQGDMAWMAREDAIRCRLDPREALPGCRTVVAVTLHYAQAADTEADDWFSPGSPARAAIARYAAGRDYHRAFEERLALLESVLRERFPSAETRPYVDYGPVMEREHAQRAGLGWIGKNTMLIHPTFGSWSLLGEVLTTAEIPPDPPFEADRCGTCARCIEACPTRAITDPRALDARLCVSYLTIELRGPIPEALRPAIGNRVFGCDICQEVCPWNDGIPAGELADHAAGWAARPVRPSTMVSWTEDLLDLSDEEFRSRYHESALARPGREGLLRNLCVGLGNSGDPRAVPVLMRCLEEVSPLVREHAVWGLVRLAEVRDAGT